jgi:hypothetical protein
MEAPRQPLEKLERVKGIEPLYSAWKSPEFRNVFKSRSDISRLFGRLRSLRNFSLSERRLLAKHSFFGTAVLGSVRVYPWSEVIPGRACWRPDAQAGHIVGL